MPTDSPYRPALEDYIREQALPVEKYGHQPRLYALTRAVGQGLAYDDDTVHAAAWLHDLGVFTGHRPEDPLLLAQWDHTAYAMGQTPALLTRFGFPQGKIPAVVECIRTHQPSDSPKTLEGTILRDADILEQLGAVGITRTLCKIGRDTRFPTFTAAAANLQRALDGLPAKLRLPQAIALAEPRILIHRSFLYSLSQESAGHLG